MSGAGGSNPSASSSSNPSASSSSSPLGPCKNCKDPSHIRRDRPHLPCARCRGMGHTIGGCTTPAGKVCFFCGASGHYLKDCPNPVLGPRCNNCGGFGHIATGNPGCATPSTVPLCIPCNQYHRQRDCTRADRPIQYSEWDGSADVCTNCRVKGHRFHNCPTKML